MDVLFFLTDRFPYGKGEAFIENEIPFLAERFDKIYILPTGLTVNTDSVRLLPENCTVLQPANTDDLYREGRPTKVKRVVWSCRHMIPWCFASLFSCEFYQELMLLVKQKRLSIGRVAAIIRSLAPTMRNVVHFRYLCKELLLDKTDRIYVYSYWMGLDVSCVDKILKGKKIYKHIARAHRHDLYSEFRKHDYIPFRERVLDTVDALCLISRDGVRYMRHKYPRYKEKYGIAYLGTKDRGIGVYHPDGTFHVVSCSFVIPVKRVKRIIEALSLVEEQQITWTHFGGGQDYESTKAYADQLLSGKSNIQYHMAGQITNSELMEYYRDHSVSLFVNVSENEGLPVSIMEAISFGIPVVATDVGGTREAFADVEDGALLDKEFATEDLKAQILRFAQMEEEAYTAKRSEARALWEERFCAESNYRKFIDEYFPKG